MLVQSQYNECGLRENYLSDVEVLYQVLLNLELI